jgi:hypothetical protein
MNLCAVEMLIPQPVQTTRIPGVFNFNYGLDGRYSQILMPNGQHRDFTFDEQGRSTQIANIHPTTGNLATYGYGYDASFSVERIFSLWSGSGPSVQLSFEVKPPWNC